MFQFQKKGHEEQYSFNVAVQGWIVEVGLQLTKAEQGHGGWSRESCSGRCDGGAE